MIETGSTPASHFSPPNLLWLAYDLTEVQQFVTEIALSLDVRLSVDVLLLTCEGKGLGHQALVAEMCHSSPPS